MDSAVSGILQSVYQRGIGRLSGRRSGPTCRAQCNRHPEQRTETETQPLPLDSSSLPYFEVLRYRPESIVLPGAKHPGRTEMLPVTLWHVWMADGTGDRTHHHKKDKSETPETHYRIGAPARNWQQWS